MSGPRPAMWTIFKYVCLCKIYVQNKKRLSLCISLQGFGMAKVTYPSNNCYLQPKTIERTSKLVWHWSVQVDEINKRGIYLFTHSASTKAINDQGGSSCGRFAATHFFIFWNQKALRMNQGPQRTQQCTGLWWKNPSWRFQHSLTQGKNAGKKFRFFLLILP